MLEECWINSAALQTRSVYFIFPVWSLKCNLHLPLYLPRWSCQWSLCACASFSPWSPPPSRSTPGWSFSPGCTDFRPPSSGKPPPLIQPLYDALYNVVLWTCAAKHHGTARFAACGKRIGTKVEHGLTVHGLASWGVGDSHADFSLDVQCIRLWQSREFFWFSWVEALPSSTL